MGYDFLVIADAIALPYFVLGIIVGVVLGCLFVAFVTWRK